MGLARRLPLPCLLLALSSCAATSTVRYDRDTLQQSLAGEDAGVVIGQFPLRPGAVVDGDTIKVEGLDSSLRLLALDTEETFKSEKDLRLYEDLGFDGYLEKKGEGSDRPVKCATPLGMDAKHFAEEFFAGITKVRLERDHPKEIRGRFNRFLVYVFAEKDGQWVNYNLEAVRAGMSPYFQKYGQSRRFHDEFVAAQEQARQAKRGIWEPGTEHYPDYDRRLAWWDARGEFVAAFEQESQGREEYVALTNWDALQRLDDLRGEWVTILATVGDVRPRRGRAPARVLLSRRLFADFPLILFDDELLQRTGLEASQGEYVIVEGTVSRYTFKNRRGRKGERSELQIEIKHPDQVRRSPGLLAADDPDAAATIERAADRLPPADAPPDEPTDDAAASPTEPDAADGSDPPPGDDALAPADPDEASDPAPADPPPPPPPPPAPPPA